MNTYFKAIFLVVVFPLLTLIAGCNSEGAFSESTIKLDRIDIIASPIITKGVSQLTLAVGNKQPFEAVGHYSDGSSRTLTDLNVSDWHTSDPDVGRFDEPGVFSATNEGHTTLTVTKDGVTSNTVDLYVSVASIKSIQVTPSPVDIAKGQTRQLTATATFNDGTSTDITSSVTWVSTDTVTATVSLKGVLSAVEVGNTTLTATKDGVTSNTADVNVSDAVIDKIDVFPSPVKIARGQTRQLKAKAIFSDGTSTDITSSATWVSTDTAIAIVSSAGVLSAVEVGNTTLTATKGDVTSSKVNVNVSDAVITDIQVIPSPVKIAKGQAQQLKAKAIFSDGTSADITSSVMWVSADSTKATVSSAGLLSAVEVGNTTLTATKGDVSSTTVNVNVSDAVITDIQVFPSSVKVEKGETRQLTATATFSDMTFSDITSSVTWVSTDTAIATVSLEGVLSAVEVGNTTLTATKDYMTSNTVDVTVCVDLAGKCIDIFDTGTGTLFTSSPSVVYLDSIGGSATNGMYTNDEAYFGPIGDFYLFDWTNANILCTTYNAHSLGGRTNWRLPTKDELRVELYDATGDMNMERGWEVSKGYWSATPDGSDNYFVYLMVGDAYSGSPSFQHYASCVSNR